jgi:hypothetical protein
MMRKVWSDISENLQKFTPIQLSLMLSVIFLLIRLPNLRALPIFNDESTYIDWGWRMVNMQGQGFHSVLHAKTPFLMWLFGLSQNIFHDPLLAGRLVSVIFGLGGALGLYFVSKEIFSKKVGIIAFFLYTLNPLFSFYDRQALMETAISTIGIWSFFLYYKLQKTDKFLVALGLGVLLGLGYFIKSNALTFAITVGFFGTYKLFKEKGVKQDKLLVFLTVVFLTAAIVLTPLIFNTSFWETLEQNQRYILTPSQLVRFPVLNWLKNFKNTLEISLIYLNPTIVLASIYSIYLLLKKNNSKGKLLILWIASGLLITNILARNASLRYVVSFLPLIIVLGSYGFNKITEKNRLIAVVLSTFLIPTFYLTFLQLSKPIKYFNLLEKISPPHSNKSHYVTNWSSGYGVNEAIEYINNEAAEKGSVIVGVRLDAGNPENAVFAYFHESKKVKPTYLDSQMFKIDLTEVDCFETSLPLYFVSRDGNMGGLHKYFEEVEKFYKPENLYFVGVHKVKTDCEGETLKLF